MALVPIKTSVGTGYCDCVHGCYELAILRDEDTGKGYCPRCGKEHLEMNQRLNLPKPAAPARGFDSLPPGALPPALQRKG